MSTRPLSNDELFSSYKSYEARVENEVKRGLLPREVARRLLASARKNYSSQQYNKQLGKCKCA